jgi:hypothetical protein
MTCRYCKIDISDNALICYRCGRPTSDPRVKPPDDGSIFAHRRRSRWPWVIVVVLIILLAAWFFLGGSYNWAWSATGSGSIAAVEAEGFASPEWSSLPPQWSSVLSRIAERAPA